MSFLFVFLFGRGEEVRGGVLAPAFELGEHPLRVLFGEVEPGHGVGERPFLAPCDEDLPRRGVDGDAVDFTVCDKIAEDLQQVLDRNTKSWGITCQTVGIKDIAIPQALAEAMSKEAQAERERRARVILGTAETEIAEKFAQASKQYTDNPVALHLRGMNMLFEGLKEKGSMVIVPSSALETMNLGAMSGLVSLAKGNENR